MHLMNIVTAYQYGSLDTNIYMKIHGLLKKPQAYKLNDHNLCSINNGPYMDQNNFDACSTIIFMNI